MDVTDIDLFWDVCISVYQVTMKGNAELKNMPTSVLQAIVDRLSNKNAIRLHAAGWKAIHHVTGPRTRDPYPIYGKDPNRRVNDPNRNTRNALSLAIQKLHNANGNSLVDTNDRIRQLVDSGATVTSDHVDDFVRLGYFKLPKTSFLRTLKILRKHAEPTEYATVNFKDRFRNSLKLSHVKNLESMGIPIGKRAVGAIFWASMHEYRIPETHQLGMLKYRLMSDVNEGISSIAMSAWRLTQNKTVMLMRDDLNEENNELNPLTTKYIDISVLTWWLVWLEPFYSLCKQSIRFTLFICVLHILTKCVDIAQLKVNTEKGTRFLASLARLVDGAVSKTVSKLLGVLLYLFPTGRYLEMGVPVHLNFIHMYEHNSALYIKILDMLVNAGARVASAVKLKPLSGSADVGQVWMKMYKEGHFEDDAYVRPIAHWIEEQHCPSATTSIIPFLNVNKVKDPRTLTYIQRLVRPNKDPNKGNHAHTFSPNAITQLKAELKEYLRKTYQ